MGYSELLMSDTYSQKEKNEFIREINKAAAKGSILTRKLLAFAKHQPAEPQITSINKVLEQQKDLISKTLTARIELVYDLQPELWSSELESHDLEDAVINLAINAMHAMGSEGTLRISTKNFVVDELDAGTFTLPAGEYVLLKVTDTGMGMDEKTLNKIFDPFFTTKKEEGTGLGLSQVYGFVKRSRGDIKVYSEPGHGTRFELYFPRSIAGKHHDALLADTAEKTTDYSGSETILIVDDEEALRLMAREMLTKHGYQVLDAEDGRQALEILAENHVDLIFSDVIMPGMTGYQLATEVRNRYPNVRLLLTSGYNDISRNEQADETLTRNLLTKPYERRELLEKIRELLQTARVPDNVTKLFDKS